jgi:beta-glucanase (GH16 family)
VAGPAQFAQPADIVLVWSDEFDTPFSEDSQVDPGTWTARDGPGFRSEQYTSNTANVRVADGRLLLEARYDAEQDPLYTSGLIHTHNKRHWTYGRIDVRAKLPIGRGTWPAIWMLPTEEHYGGWPGSGEIDIMEHFGEGPTTVFGTVHTKAFNWRNTPPNGHGSSIVVSTAETEFHIYTVEWSPDRIDFYVDNDKFHTFPNQSGNWEQWPFDRPFYLLLNVTVGGTEAGIDNEAFPATMEIDYVRLYKKDD